MWRIFCLPKSFPTLTQVAFCLVQEFVSSLFSLHDFLFHHPPAPSHPPLAKSLLNGTSPRLNHNFSRCKHPSFFCCFRAMRPRRLQELLQSTERNVRRNTAPSSADQTARIFGVVIRIPVQVSRVWLLILVSRLVTLLY